MQAGIDEIYWSATPTTREARGGYRAKLQKEVKTNDSTQIFNFYTNRIVKNWNYNADTTVTAPLTQQTASKAGLTSTKKATTGQQSFVRHESDHAEVSRTTTITTATI